jgi:hypothetical protein
MSTCGSCAGCRERKAFGENRFTRRSSSSDIPVRPGVGEALQTLLALERLQQSDSVREMGTVNKNEDRPFHLNAGACVR